MQGPKAKVVKTFKFTLPEGRSIGARTRRWSRRARSRATTRRRPRARRFLRRAHALGLPPSAKNLEGFLFPATYEMISGASAKDLVKRQLDAYEQNVAKVPMKTAPRSAT